MRTVYSTWVTVLLVTVLAAQERAPLNRAEIYRLEAGGVSEQRILKLVAENGINFEPTDENLQALKQMGATPVLLEGLLSARLKEHTQAAKQLDTDGRHADAQKEWRLALALAPSDGALHFGLGESLLADNQPDEAVRELNVAAATEPGAEDRLQAAREQVERKRREMAEEAERQRVLAQEENARRVEEEAHRAEIHRTTGLAGRWMEDNRSSLVYTVTVSDSEWRAVFVESDGGSWEYSGRINGRTIVGTAIRKYRDRACRKDRVVEGEMTASISEDGNSILISYQWPNTRSTGLFGCGEQVVGYTSRQAQLTRVP